LVERIGLSRLLKEASELALNFFANEAVLSDASVSLIELLHGRWLEAPDKYERRIPLTDGADHIFFAATFFMISISRSRSTTSFLSPTFSVSSCFRRLTWFA
jgi:hypothetical protein